jgi:hypothetical protein
VVVCCATAGVANAIAAAANRAKLFMRR